MNEKSENVYKLGGILEAIIAKLGPEFSDEIEAGITEMQFMVMKLLHYRECTMVSLTEHLGLKPGAINSILENMYQIGLIGSRRSKVDPSTMKYSLTDKGVITFKKCWEKRDRLMKNFLMLLDEADQNKLIEILGKIPRI